MELPITGFKVDIVTYLTWGEKEDIQSAMMNDVSVNAKGESSGLSLKAITEAKYKAFECTIKKITTKEGTDVPYSKEWIRDLHSSDGEFLYTAIDELSKKKD